MNGRGCAQDTAQLAAVHGDWKATSPGEQQHQDTASGPSQLDGKRYDSIALPPTSGTRRHFTLTSFRHVARLDQFASEGGRYSPAPASEVDASSASAFDDEAETESVNGGRFNHREDPDDTQSMMSGYKRGASEMEGNDGEEEEAAASRNRYRRSDTPVSLPGSSFCVDGLRPDCGRLTCNGRCLSAGRNQFTESDYPGHDAASFVTSEAPSRTESGRRRARSVGFSQRSLYSERSHDDEDLFGSSESHTGEGHLKPIVTKVDETGTGDRHMGDDHHRDDDISDEAGESQYIIDFDPLMPMASLYLGTKHPYLAHAAALAQAAQETKATKTPQTQAAGENQENVAPCASLAPEESETAILEQWRGARAEVSARFGALLSKVDQLLECVAWPVPARERAVTLMHSLFLQINERPPLPPSPSAAAIAAKSNATSSSTRL